MQWLNIIKVFLTLLASIFEAARLERERGLGAAEAILKVTQEANVLLQKARAARRAVIDDLHNTNRLYNNDGHQRVNEDKL